MTPSRPHYARESRSPNESFCDALDLCEVVRLEPGTSNIHSMKNHETDESLSAILAAKHISASLIDAVADAGFYMRSWIDPFAGKTWRSVSDLMYGNKQFSSSFELDDFIKYIHGQHIFPAPPPLRCYEAKSIEDIEHILADPVRAHYLSEGSFTYRGQPQEYKYKRKIPSPVRADQAGYEISTLPGVYRQREHFYSFAIPYQESRSFDSILPLLEPNNPDVWLDHSFALDIMRTEQHYATQTSGLDVSFEMDTAIFFATHKFRWTTAGKAYYEPVETGEHTGVIYCFRFRDPPVKRTQHLIKDFDLFKTLQPLRIIRQDCGLPLLGPHERNIALTDMDCIIRLHPDFLLPESFRKTPPFMFPSTSEDMFYGKLLELRDQFPEELGSVVEYQWSQRLRRPQN